MLHPRIFLKSPQRKRVCRLLNKDFTYLFTYLLIGKETSVPFDSLHHILTVSQGPQI
jgi:hypothetical protein